MDKQNDMAQLRYLEEVAISLKRAGFDTERIEDHHLPVTWNGSYLCRISGKGSVLYRQQNVDANGAQAELQNVIDIAKTTSEYMAMMERAPQLKARDLEGDYLWQHRRTFPGTERSCGLAFRPVSYFFSKIFVSQISYPSIFPESSY